MRARTWGLSPPQASMVMVGPRAGTDAAPPPAPLLLQPGWEVGSQNHRIIGWKRPLRSSGPTTRPTAPCLLRGWREGSELLRVIPPVPGAAVEVRLKKGVIFKHHISAQTVVAALRTFPGGWGSQGGLSQLGVSP